MRLISTMAKEQLDRGGGLGAFLKDYKIQNHMQNKNEGNENKITLGDLNCTMGKIDRDGENKTQRLYRCCSNYALWKLIVDNELEDIWRRENPNCLEFTCYDRSFAMDSGYTGSILTSILIYKFLTKPRLIT